MITRWVVRRLDDRLRVAPVARSTLNKVFPDHWSFMMGEIALYAFLYLLASGVFLTLFFEPSEAPAVYDGGYEPMRGTEVSAAYASAVRLSLDVPFGLVMRQSHHWAALVFVGAIVLHLCRVFFTGAFRRPRELNWVVGVTLLLLAVVNGFAGYSLPDDILSGTGLRLLNAVLLSVPVVGSWAAFLVFGAEFPGESFLARLYAVHVLIIPALITALLVAHMAILVRQKHSQFPGPGRTETNVVGSRLWPGYAARSAGLLFGVFAVLLVLGGLVQINPVWLYGHFEPGRATAPAQPDWYLGWIDGALRLFPPWEPSVAGYVLPSVFLPGVALPALTFLLLYAWPFLERLFTKDRSSHELLERPRDRPVRVGVGVAALTFYGTLLAAFGVDLVSLWTRIPVTTLFAVFGVAVLVLPPVTGAVAFVLARALRDSGAADLPALTWSDVRAGGRPRRRRPGRPRHGAAAGAGRASSGGPVP